LNLGSVGFAGAGAGFGAGTGLTPVTGFVGDGTAGVFAFEGTGSDLPVEGSFTTGAAAIPLPFDVGGITVDLFEESTLVTWPIGLAEVVD
jgi:hypothetical protein